MQVKRGHHVRSVQILQHRRIPLAWDIGISIYCFDRSNILEFKNGTSHAAINIERLRGADKSAIQDTACGGLLWVSDVLR